MGRIMKLLTIESIMKTNVENIMLIVSPRFKTGKLYVVNYSSLPHVYVEKYLLLQNLISKNVSVVISPMLPQKLLYNPIKKCLTTPKSFSQTTMMLIDADDANIKNKTDLTVLMYKGHIAQYEIPLEPAPINATGLLTMTVIDHHASNAVAQELRYTQLDINVDRLINNHVIYYPIIAPWASGTAGVCALSHMLKINLAIMEKLQTVHTDWVYSKSRYFYLLENNRWCIANMDVGINKGINMKRLGEINNIPSKIGPIPLSKFVVNNKTKIDVFTHIKFLFTLIYGLLYYPLKLIYNMLFGSSPKSNKRKPKVK
jgi:hypothetical protein